MAQRPILETERLHYRPVSEYELEKALAYAARDRSEILYTRGEKKGQIKSKAYAGEVLDYDMLEVFANTVLKRRTSRSKLAFLAATVVREKIKSTDQRNRDRVDAYKGAIMKIMSDRATRKRQVDSSSGPKSDRHPLDPRRQGQYMLL